MLIILNMKQDWSLCRYLLAAILLIFLSSKVNALEDFHKLCPTGNVTIVSSNSKPLVTPDRCFPIPVLNRNELGYKPRVQVSTASPRLPFRYSIVMFDINSTFDKYDVYWMETNLTANMYHFLEPNISIPRDIRKMVEYRPPKLSPLNITYVILVYRQSTIPVESPPRMPFKPNSWAVSSALSLIGGAKFIVRGANATTHLPPAHHQPLPLPPAVIPGSRAPPYPQQPPLPNINAPQYNYTYHRNYTNNTNYHPPYHPPYHPQPIHPSNQYYPPNNNYIPPKKGKRGAAVDLQAVSSLIIFTTAISFVLNL